MPQNIMLGFCAHSTVTNTIVMYEKVLCVAFICGVV